MNDEAEDADQLVIAERLVAERPLPNAGYRADLRARLLASIPDQAPPRRLRPLIAVYAGSGALLLVVAAIGVAGIGPLAG